MYKQLAHFLLVVALLSIGVGLQSCSDDKEDVIPPVSLDDSLIGTWELQYALNEDGEKVEIEPDEGVTFKFRSDHSLIITYKDNNESVPCTWTTDGDSMTIGFGIMDNDSPYEYDEIYKGTFTIKNKTLTLDMSVFDGETNDYYGELNYTLKKVSK